MSKTSVTAAEVAAALWPLAALTAARRSAAAAGCLQLRQRQRRKVAAWAVEWLRFVWPARACCRATAQATRAWAADAARLLLLRLQGPRYLRGSRLVEGRVTFEAPYPRPEGQRAEVGNLSASGLLSEAQEAMLEWSAARAEWWYTQPPALDLPQARLEWDVYTLRVSFPGSGALRRRAHVVLTMATIV